VIIRPMVYYLVREKEKINEMHLIIVVVYQIAYKQRVLQKPNLLLY
jgi:hypothetical protein